MQKITNYIFSLSPKKLAIYLILGPLSLFLTHTLTTLIFRSSGATSPTANTTVASISCLLILFTALIGFLAICWLRGTVYAVDETQLGLHRKWFRIAYIFLWFFILFNSAASAIEFLVETQSWNGTYMHLIYASRESINFGGIIIAYPIVCHYAARAATSKRNKNSASFLSALPFTLFLVFGTLVGIPFLHKYFAQNTSTNAQIVRIYAIALGLCALLFSIGFFAAITGLV